MSGRAVAHAVRGVAAHPAPGRGMARPGPVRRIIQKSPQAALRPGTVARSTTTTSTPNGSSLDVQSHGQSSRMLADGEVQLRPFTASCVASRNGTTDVDLVLGQPWPSSRMLAESACSSDDAQQEVSMRTKALGKSNFVKSTDQTTAFNDDDASDLDHVLGLVWPSSRIPVTNMLDLEFDFPSSRMVPDGGIHTRHFTREDFGKQQKRQALSDSWSHDILLGLSWPSSRMPVTNSDKIAAKLNETEHVVAAVRAALLDASSTPTRILKAHSPTQKMIRPGSSVARHLSTGLHQTDTNTTTSVFLSKLSSRGIVEPLLSAAQLIGGAPARRGDTVALKLPETAVRRIARLQLGVSQHPPPGRGIQRPGPMRRNNQSGRS